ncbi:unnamed protein product [Oppiella nova]|uniref:Histidine protein methyltransferase 1 n=1 Tax=Oppiella nova TaxID=334625 RepID=A0A7R9LGL5_9ACAR|nr:unnamed protein product [Oppiella nova]CAG2162737.1 unnamed protein product [Oppiella nova]
MPDLKVDYKCIENNLKAFLSDRSLTSDLQILNDLSVKPIKYANPELIKLFIRNHNDDKELKSPVDLIDGNTDLITNEYEGGYKIWEGLHDLIDYFIDFKVVDNFANHQGLHVLETVNPTPRPNRRYMTRFFTGFRVKIDVLINEDVIKYFTAVNVVLNSDLADSHHRDSHFHYLYGDWCAIADDIDSSGVKYDLIFTSETLYNCDNYEKLCKVFKSSLTPNGTVYIASKSHYFGVGGGTYSFIDFVEADGRFAAEISHEIETPLIRHIIKLSLK